mgnify:CR=1 FL=1
MDGESNFVDRAMIRGNGHEGDFLNKQGAYIIGYLTKNNYIIWNNMTVGIIRRILLMLTIDKRRHDLMSVLLAQFYTR